MIRVGIVGCGKMADQHVFQIVRIANAQIVALCDKEPMMAEQLGERIGGTKCYSNIEMMLKCSDLDVVHVTTPPHTHFAIGRTCLEAGCNVYMEKPFTIDTTEAEQLIEIANRNNVKITAGHNAQFTHAMIKGRKLVESGYLGEGPIHIESHYCYDFGDINYAKSILNDDTHWVRALPGSLLQNIISHGVAKIAEYIKCDYPTIIAQGFTSSFLRDLGEDEIIDEVRVIIKDDNNTTAYFTFSSQIKPVPHCLHLYGKSNSLIIDDEYQLVIKMPNHELKSYLRYFYPPFFFASQYLSNFFVNFTKFLKRDFHMPNDAGLKTLIDLFYSSIVTDKPLPLSYREIILTTRIMDSIFEQLPNKV